MKPIRKGLMTEKNRLVEIGSLIKRDELERGNIELSLGVVVCLKWLEIAQTRSSRLTDAFMRYVDG